MQTERFRRVFHSADLWFISSVIWNDFTKNQESIAKAAGEHKLSVIAEKSMITVDQSIINDREARLRNITALRDAADRAVEKYNKLSEPKDNAISIGNTIKNGVKFAILGVIAGVFLCCFSSID